MAVQELANTKVECKYSLLGSPSFLFLCLTISPVKDAQKALVSLKNNAMETEREKLNDLKHKLVDFLQEFRFPTANGEDEDI